MNVTDLRTVVRRSSTTADTAELAIDDRRKGDRRQSQTPEKPVTIEKRHRIWLTPGEKALIEDLYLLDS